MTQSVNDWHINKDWTLFLDRDGVINDRNFDGYIILPEHFTFKEGVIEALNKLNKVFGKIILVTNQQGIAKGIMTKRNLNDIHRYMSKELEKNIGWSFDAIFFADNFKGASIDRRKPNKAMALEAKDLFPIIDFNKSVMIGDTDGDIKFGTNLGMKTVLVNSKETVTEKPTIAVDSLLEFALKLNK